MRECSCDGGKASTKGGICCFSNPELGLEWCFEAGFEQCQRACPSYDDSQCSQ